MKKATAGLFAIFFLTLVGSATLPAPQWIWCLWAAPVMGAVALAGIILSAMGVFLGPEARRVVPFVGAALALADVVAIEAAELALAFVQTAEMPPLEQVDVKLCAMGALGTALSAIWMGWHGMKSASIPPRCAGVLSISLGVYGLACVPVALAIAFPPPWMCASVALLGGGLAMVTGKEGAPKDGR